MLEVTSHVNRRLCCLCTLRQNGLGPCLWGDLPRVPIQTHDWPSRQPCILPFVSKGHFLTLSAIHQTISSAPGVPHPLQRTLGRRLELGLAFQEFPVQWGRQTSLHLQWNTACKCPVEAHSFAHSVSQQIYAESLSQARHCFCSNRSLIFRSYLHIHALYEALDGKMEKNSAEK